MRIRSTKPEFWRSERISSVSWDARLVLKGLESYADDNGVGKDDLALIVADVFPRDLSRNPPGTLQRVSEAISELAEAGLLWRYEANDTKLIFIAFWESVQRIEKPTKGRFPRPDGTMNYRDSEIRQPIPESSRNVPGTLRPGTGEQGNRGTEEQRIRGTDSSADADDAPTHDPTVEDLCTHLAARIEANGSKRPPITKRWRQACRLMLDRDQRTPEQIRAAIDWCQADDFWRSNVMSMPKLREKFDTLRLQAGRSRAAPSQRIATADQRLADGMALARKLAAEESQTRLELGA